MIQCDYTRLHLSTLYRVLLWPAQGKGIGKKQNSSVYEELGWEFDRCRLNLDYARPERLVTILQRFQKVDFVLLHCGPPWTFEAAILAKHFSNIYLDMAWMHTISEEISVQSLKMRIDLVPRNKVMRFGGDCHIESRSMPTWQWPEAIFCVRW